MAPIARPRAVPLARASPASRSAGPFAFGPRPPYAMPGLKAALIAAELALAAAGTASVVVMLALVL